MTDCHRRVFSTFREQVPSSKGLTSFSASLSSSNRTPIWCAIWGITSCRSESCKPGKSLSNKRSGSLSLGILEIRFIIEQDESPTCPGQRVIYILSLLIYYYSYPQYRIWAILAFIECRFLSLQMNIFQDLDFSSQHFCCPLKRTYDKRCAYASRSSLDLVPG